MGTGYPPRSCLPKRGQLSSTKMTLNLYRDSLIIKNRDVAEQSLGKGVCSLKGPRLIDKNNASLRQTIKAHRRYGVLKNDRVRSLTVPEAREEKHQSSHCDAGKRRH